MLHGALSLCYWLVNCMTLIDVDSLDGFKGYDLCNNLVKS